jgi:hypothetical protein
LSSLLNKTSLTERDICTKFITPALAEAGWDIDTANQSNIGVTTIKSCLFPLPPLAEQQRIVAKAQQLQQQLSRLEAQVQQSRQYAQQLLQSVLKEAFEQKGKVYEMKEEVSMVKSPGLTLITAKK